MNRYDLEYWRAMKARKEYRAVEAERIRLEKSKTPPPKRDTIPLEVIKKSNLANLMFNVKHIGGKHLFVGIPGDTPTALRRRQAISKRASRFTSPNKKSQQMKQRLLSAKSGTTLSNAYLLSIFERGSPLRKQPPRPLFKTVLLDDAGNKKKIAQLLGESTKALLDGDEARSINILKKTGSFAAKALRDYFEASDWPRNAPATVAHKGFDKPGVYTAAMKNAITYQLVDYKDPNDKPGRMEKIT
jgi:hypothetical protein